MKRWLVCALVSFSLVGCKTAPQPSGTPPIATPTSPSRPALNVEELAAAIAADANRSDHEQDSKVRTALAEEASRDAAACLELEPQSAACLYGRALALGLQARVHPARAGELLNAMLVSLGGADAADPGYDEAGPARVRALVLIRAPGWPLGPGDTEAGLVAAHRAASLRPQYPPNILALAESQAKTGDAKGARENYQRARALALALPAATDRDDWIRQADEALRRQ